MNLTQISLYHTTWDNTRAPVPAMFKTRPFWYNEPNPNLIILHTLGERTQTKPHYTQQFGTIV
jgi:hypothetical protein